MNDLAGMMPKMMIGNDLTDALGVYPEYDETICHASRTKRLIALSDLYKIYVPSSMSAEIYSKFYLALLHSLQKKTSREAAIQKNRNHSAILRQEQNGIIGGSDSFTVIGASGIGKSSAIKRSIELLSVNGIIETRVPYAKIIPCAVVQCPFDSSARGLLLEILRSVDETIGSEYYKNAVKARTTTDMLIGCVSQVAMNHIGLLVVDEIQNVVYSKNGRNLVGMLTQLINNSGISICMVGTPECADFFEQAFQLARRSLGLQYQALPCNQYFDEFCRILLSYRYTRYRGEISGRETEWLYEHSGGIVSVVVSLVHDAQEIAILSGKDILDGDMLEEAYQKRLTLLHQYTEPSIEKKKQTSAVRRQNALPDPEQNLRPHAPEISIAKVVTDAMANGDDAAAALKKAITIEEVRI